MTPAVANTPARPWLRDGASRLLLMGLGLLAALVLTEGLARYLVPAPGRARFEPDPEVGFRHAPGQRIWLTNEAHEFGVWFTTNMHGDPDVERSLQKPAGSYRIAVLGDSMVEASQVEQAERFTAVLEQQLTAWAQAALGSTQQVEVMNFGTASYGTAQEWLYYEGHARRFAPDLVLLVIFPGNDVQNNSYALEVERAGRPEIMPFFYLSDSGELVLKDRSYLENARARYDAAAEASIRRDGWSSYLGDRFRLVSLLREAYAGLRAGSEAGYSPEALRQIGVWAELYDPVRQASSPEWQQAWAITAALIAEVEASAAQDGAGFQVVIVPGRWEATPDGRALLTRASTQTEFDWSLPNRTTAALLEDAGLPYTNLLPPVAAAYEAANKPLHFPIDGHLTPAGHRLIAEELLPMLQPYVAAAD